MLIRRRAAPRRGRVVDEPFMEFARAQGCILKDMHRCVPPVTFHHVRECGSPKNDTEGFGLCLAGHLHDFGEHSIERGKRQFEEYWGISIKAEIAKLQEKFRRAESNGK